MRAAVELLVQRVPAPHQNEARARMVALLGQVAAEPGLPAPAWLASLEGGAEAYAAAPPARTLVVDLHGGRPVVVPALEDADAARAVAEAIATTTGIWEERIYYPPRAVLRVRLSP